MAKFTVDLDRLETIVDEITRFDQRLESALADADARVNQLHVTWTGAAADAHRKAHQEWQRGAAEMRAALAVLRQCATTAQDNYHAATTTNARMWESMR